MTTETNPYKTLNIPGEVAKARAIKPRTHKGKLDSLPPHLQLYLLRELAIGTPGTDLAAEMDVTPQSISAFRKRHAQDITNQKNDIKNEFAALWIADKANRIAAYEQEIDRLNGHQHADHHEWSKARQQALRNVAEELGQLPPRQTITVNAVTHVIEGVNIDTDLT